MTTIGTAGHIDHGKSSLVRALTGMDPDRLPVERDRGITTELGFAHVQLGERAISVVDVPGHEKFVRAMVAGATGFDLVLLVIACDAGVMPQTREHVAICDLLGIERAIVVLSKRDLVDAPMAQLCADEARALLEPTGMRGAPIVELSTKTGEGIAQLRSQLEASLSRESATASRLLRLPIDRVFTMRGFGTVVTGTMIGGELTVGDEVVLHPSERVVRARGIQVHGTAVPTAITGQRVAVNVSGVAVNDVARGDVLLRVGEVAGSHILDVRVRHLPSGTKAWPRRQVVSVAHGTSQHPATLTLGPPGELLPGEEGTAQLRLDARTPLAAIVGDRFVLRGSRNASYGTTIGGGVVTRVLSAKVRGTEPRQLVQAVDGAAEQLLREVTTAGVVGRTLAELAPRLGLPQDEVEELLAAAIAKGVVQVLAERAFATATVAALTAQLRQPFLQQLEVSRTHLRAQLPSSLAPAVAEQILSQLVASPDMVVEQATDLVSLRRVAPTPVVDPLLDKLRSHFVDWALAPPKPKEVAQLVGEPSDPVRLAITRLLAARELVKINPDYVVDGGAYAAVRAKLDQAIADGKSLSPGDFKTLTGLSRKYSIPLAEHFDAIRVTKRVGEVRRAFASR